MNTARSSISLETLKRNQLRLRIWLATVLIAATCLFALLLSWLGQNSPLQPLLSIKTSFFALLTVYAIGIGAAATYARWIRVTREPALKAIANKN